MFHVYLLPHAHDPVFKIGVAIKVLSRAKSVPESFDLRRGLQLRCINEAIAKRVERLLHTVFADRRRPRQDGDGYTEWFASECWDEAVAVLRSTGSALGGGALEPVAVPPMLPPDSPEVLAKRARARQLRQLQSQEQELQRAERNAQSERLLAEIMARLEQSSAVLGVWTTPWAKRMLVLDTPKLEPWDAQTAHWPWGRVNFTYNLPEKSGAYAIFPGSSGNEVLTFVTVLDRGIGDEKLESVNDVFDRLPTPDAEKARAWQVAFEEIDAWVWSFFNKNDAPILAAPILAN